MIMTPDIKHESALANLRALEARNAFLEAAVALIRAEATRMSFLDGGSPVDVFLKDVATGLAGVPSSCPDFAQAIQCLENAADAWMAGVHDGVICDAQMLRIRPDGTIPQKYEHNDTPTPDRADAIARIRVAIRADLLDGVTPSRTWSQWSIDLDC